MIDTNFLFMDSISDSGPSSFFQSIRLKTESSLSLLALEKSNLVMVERDERSGLNWFERAEGTWNWRWSKLWSEYEGIGVEVQTEVWIPESRKMRSRMALSLVGTPTLWVRSNSEVRSLRSWKANLSSWLPGEGTGMIPSSELHHSTIEWGKLKSPARTVLYEGSVLLRSRR